MDVETNIRLVSKGGDRRYWIQSVTFGIVMLIGTVMQVIFMDEIFCGLVKNSSSLSLLQFNSSNIEE